MLDDDTLRHLRSQSLEGLVGSLERLYQRRSEHSLPLELRSTAADAGAASTRVNDWGSPAAPMPAAPSCPDLEPRVEAPGEPQAASTDVDLASTCSAVLAEYEGLLRRYNEDFDRLFHRTHPQVTPADAAAEAPLAEDSDSTAAIIERLRRAQLLLFKFPIAAQSAFAAFVEEGRRYGRSIEGARWKQALEGSPLLGEVQGILNALSLGTLRESPDTLIPSAIVDLLTSAASHKDLRAILARAFTPKAG